MSSSSEDDSSLEGGVRTPRKQTEQARRTLQSLDDLVSRTSPKCQPQSVLRGVSSGVLSRRCSSPAMRLTTKSASRHAAIGSSWRGVLRVGFRGMPSWRRRGCWRLASRQARTSIVPVDHEGVPHAGDELCEVAGGLSRPGQSRHGVNTVGDEVLLDVPPHIPSHQPGVQAFLGVVVDPCPRTRRSMAGWVLQLPPWSTFGQKANGATQSGVCSPLTQSRTVSAAVFGSCVDESVDAGLR